jgi:hypothetical protein
VTVAKIDLKTAPLSLLKAVAIAIAREIDGGDGEKRDLLEEVFEFIETAK